VGVAGDEIVDAKAGDGHTPIPSPLPGLPRCGHAVHAGTAVVADDADRAQDRGMSISCLRVHDLVSGDADPGDARVVLVDRLWPRGVSKKFFAHDEWCKDAAPSP